MGLTGHLSNPPEPLADLLSFFELAREKPKNKRRKHNHCNKLQALQLFDCALRRKVVSG
jgi:hypothetical protein